MMMSTADTNACTLEARQYVPVLSLRPYPPGAVKCIVALDVHATPVASHAALAAEGTKSTDDRLYKPTVRGIHERSDMLCSALRRLNNSNNGRTPVWERH